MRNLETDLMYRLEVPKLGFLNPRIMLDDPWDRKKTLKLLLICIFKLKTKNLSFLNVFCTH